MGKKITKLFLIILYSFYPLNLFSQDNLIFQDKNSYKYNGFSENVYQPLYVGNYFSSLFAFKNGDYHNSLIFSKLSLESKVDSMELLENAFNSNIYLGKIENALEVVSSIELLTDNLDQKFLYPTISEQLKRTDLSSAEEISNNLGFEKHAVFINKMISIWNHVVLGQKASALMHLDKFIDENKLNPEVYYYLKVQGLIIASYFDDTEEINYRYNFLKGEIKKIPNRHYIDISKVIYEKINKEEAKEFLIRNLPKNLDLSLSIRNLEKNIKNELNYYLAKVFYEAGFIIAKSKGYIQSIPYFWYSLHIDKNNDPSRLILSSFFTNLKQIDIALDVLNGSLIKSPSWVIIEFEKSFLYEKQGKIDLAISLIENFIKNNGFSKESLLRISNIFRRNKDYKQSLETLNKIDLLKADLPEVYYYKSLNLVLLKEWGNAIETFEILLEKYPNNSEISNFVGYVLVDRNVRLDEGIDLIKFAVNQEPNNGFFIDSLGWAYYKLGEISKAIVYLERAIELEPQEIEINDHLGDAYFKAGRLGEARLVWKRAITLNGDGDIKKSIKSKLQMNF